jgi:hypothetical protein
MLHFWFGLQLKLGGVNADGHGMVFGRIGVAIRQVLFARVYVNMFEDDCEEILIHSMPTLLHHSRILISQKRAFLHVSKGDPRIVEIL